MRKIDLYFVRPILFFFVLLLPSVVKSADGPPIPNIYIPMPSENVISSCSLITPPNSSITWEFEGDQVVYLRAQNRNVLGVAVEITQTYGGSGTSAIWLAPLSCSEPMRYDILGYTPITRVFSISTQADAACVFFRAYSQI